MVGVGRTGVGATVVGPEAVAVTVEVSAGDSSEDPEQAEITAIANAANKSDGTVVPHLRTAVVSVSPRKTASIL